MTNKIKNSFLMNCFQEFVNEMFKFREIILFDAKSINAEEMQKTLIRFIFYKRDFAMQEGALIEAGYLEISYIMAVFADEIFINLDWDFQKQWKKNNLETQIFGTHIGGKKLFSDIEKFLSANSAYKYDIGSAYLFCLGLGFRGEYRGIDDNNLISQYKEKLFEYINNGASNLFEQNFSLFPETKQHTIVRVSSVKITNFKVWSMILGITALTYISVSYILWNNSAIEIASLIQAAQKDIESIKNG